MLANIEERFLANLERVEDMIALYDDWAGAARGRPSVREGDVLRGAVILLHATLEDLLRDLALELLPFADKDILSRVPFAGGDGRKTTFTLGDLAGYRNRGVDDLIAESLRLYLNRRSYNNIDDIAAALREVGVKGTEIKILIDAADSDLQALIQRRHVIAHRLDRNDLVGRGQHPARSIAKVTVVKWIGCVRSFGGNVLASLSDDPFLDGGT